MIYLASLSMAVSAGLAAFAVLDYLADRRYLRALSKASDLLAHRHRTAA